MTVDTSWRICKEDAPADLGELVHTLMANFKLVDVRNHGRNFWRMGCGLDDHGARAICMICVALCNRQRFFRRIGGIFIQNKNNIIKKTPDFFLRSDFHAPRAVCIATSITWFGTSRGT